MSYTKETYPTSAIEFKWKPRKFYLKRIAKIPPESQQSSIGMDIGKVGHKVCEHFYDEINYDLADTNSESHFLDVVTALREQHWNYDIPFDRVDEVDSFLRNFAVNSAQTFETLKKQNKLDIFAPLHTELEIVSPSLGIGAILDRINKSYNLLDYKTDKYFPDIIYKNPADLTPQEKVKYRFTKDKLLIQSTLGAIVVEEEFGVRPKFFTFAYLRHLNTNGTKGIVRLDVTQENIDSVLAFIQKMKTSIENNEFPKCTDKDPGACYQYNRVCEFKVSCDALGLCIHDF